MSTPITTERVAALSPRTVARITGGLYLLFFLTAVLGAFFTPATASAILAQESSFRLGWALTLISTACYVAVVALFYPLFRPVSRSLAVLAAFFGLVGCAITAVGSLFQLAPLVELGGSQTLSAFDAKQAQALAQTFLDLNAQAGSVALVFFAMFLLLISSLIFRSTFLPRILAAPMALAGVGWLTFLWPPLAHALLTPIEVLGFVAELLLALWLLVVSVNAQRWKEQASAAGVSPRS
jgi:hypothetical protein